MSSSSAAAKHLSPKVSCVEQRTFCGTSTKAAKDDLQTNIIS